ncbi:MAG: homoserine kinase [Bacteroidia bacterium]|nr:homoserine kinase [Bacteroidia bacterium]
MDMIRIFCPATVSNLSCGYDVLGLALEQVGEEMIIRKASDDQLTIRQTEGPEIPLDPAKNVAGVAARSLLDHLGIKEGFEIEIAKRIKPGSGIGSSAASASGAVWGINQLLGAPLSTMELLPHAMTGEAIASNAWHADNVAPCLLGGFVLIRSYDPLDVIQLSFPNDLALTIIHPHIEIKTAEARTLIGDKILLKNAVAQWGNLGGLIAGLASGDHDLISRSLVDHLAEPKRKHLIPGYDEMKSVALAAGALGFGISGSGPSVFALCKGMKKAEEVGEKLAASFSPLNIAFDLHCSRIHTEGIRIIP